MCSKTQRHSADVCASSFFRDETEKERGSPKKKRAQKMKASNVKKQKRESNWKPGSRAHSSSSAGVGGGSRGLG
jgi:hypothetical protein